MLCNCIYKPIADTPSRSAAEDDQIWIQPQIRAPLELHSRATPSAGGTSPLPWSRHRKKFQRKADNKKMVSSETKWFTKKDLKVSSISCFMQLCPIAIEKPIIEFGLFLHPSTIWPTEYKSLQIGINITFIVASLCRKWKKQVILATSPYLLLI